MSSEPSLRSGSEWSARNTPPTAARHYVFTGIAYPHIKQGSNATTLVTADRSNRQAFYHDPAVTLSESDMNAFNGTEGAPLCVEHDRADVVGSVHHTWLGGPKGRTLKIIGRISLDTPRGRQVAAAVQAGRYKGLSVGYATDIDERDNSVCEKRFREISLVEEPFFDGCHLAPVAVLASSQPPSGGLGDQLQPIRNAQDNRNTLVCDLRIEASNMDPTTTAAGAPNGALTMPANTPATAAGQQQQQAELSQELLGEATKMKEQLANELKQKEATAAKMKQMEEMLARFQADEAKRTAEYAAAQEPKAKAYIETLTASKGGVAPSAQHVKEIMATFCDPRYKEGAAELEHTHKYMQELQASKKAAEERAAAAEAQAKTYQSAMTKTTEVLNHSRSDFASALQPRDAAADEQRRKNVLETTVVAGANGLSLSHIMVPEPSVQEMSFMKAFGYGSTTEVTASKQDPYAPEVRPYLKSVPVAASHRHQYDADGNRQQPNSWRWGHHGAAPYFAWMCTLDELRSDSGADLGDAVSMSTNPKYAFYEQKNTDMSGLGAMSVGGAGGAK